MRIAADNIARALSAIVLVVAAASAAETPLVLSPNTLGPLPLGKGAKVSEQQIKKLFPQFIVTYDIGSGDSPDFHYFEVKDKDGRVVFAIKSFIEESNEGKKTAEAVSVSILQVYSPLVTDSHGLRVGDRVKDIVKKRGTGLHFGASHHDVYLGSESIFYNIATGSEQSPENLTIEDSIKGNWPIRSISWPEPAWE